MEMFADIDERRMLATRIDGMREAAADIIGVLFGK
jgi:hypothetical protein